jgi:hypothetical protein
MRTPKSPASRCWWPLLFVAFAAQAQDDAAQLEDQAAAAPEFLDFLEYLGSWDGDEQDWVQFMDVDEKVPAQDPGTPKREVEQVELEDVDDVVS